MRTVITRLMRIKYFMIVGSVQMTNFRGTRFNRCPVKAASTVRSCQRNSYFRMMEPTRAKVGCPLCRAASRTARSSLARPTTASWSEPQKSRKGPQSLYKFSVSTLKPQYKGHICTTVRSTVKSRNYDRARSALNPPL